MGRSKSHDESGQKASGEADLTSSWDVELIGSTDQFFLWSIELGKAPLRPILELKVEHYQSRVLADSQNYFGIRLGLGWPPVTDWTPRP